MVRQPPLQSPRHIRSDHIFQISVVSGGHNLGAYVRALLMSDTFNQRVRFSIGLSPFPLTRPSRARR